MSKNPHSYYPSIQEVAVGYVIRKIGWGVPDQTFVSAAQLGRNSAYFASKEEAEDAKAKLPSFGSNFGKGWGGGYRIEKEIVPAEYIS